MLNKTKTIKYAKIALAKITKGFKDEVYLKTGFFTPGPNKVYYLVSNKCNFRCKMCPQWERGFKEIEEQYISEDRIKEIIKEMAKLKIPEFGISGGEPLLYKDKVLRLLSYANAQGIYTHFATNGSLLTKDFLEKYNEAGGGHVSMSLDAVGDRYDEWRGFSGASEGALRVLRLFKENKFNNINLKLNITLTNENLGDVMGILRLADEAGAMAFIQPLDVYDYKSRDIKSWQEKFPLWVKKENEARLKRLVKELKEFKKAKPAVLLNDFGHLNAFYDYFTKDYFFKACYAPLEQLTINPFGEVILCKFGAIGDLKKMALKEYLVSEQRINIIKAALNCRQGCLLGCMHRSGLKELLKNGPRQFLKLIK